VGILQHFRRKKKSKFERVTCRGREHWRAGMAKDKNLPCWTILEPGSTFEPSIRRSLAQAAPYVEQLHVVLYLTATTEVLEACC